MDYTLKTVNECLIELLFEAGVTDPEQASKLINKFWKKFNLKVKKYMPKEQI